MGRMTKTLYKVISEENKAKDGGTFDYTPYLPKGDTPGEWTPEISDMEECKRGYHITWYWNMYYDKGCRIFEVEAKNMQTKEEGVCDKHVASSIRFIREFFPAFQDAKFNTGDMNTGDRNTGDWNTGYRNTGNRNTGDWNTGYRNTGYMNTGDRNTGHRNTGDRNTGNRNTGYWNTGDWNTGNRNTGYWNTGDWNTGDWNTGDGNTGDGNTGHRNTGNWNTGDGNTGDGNTGHRNTGNWNTGNWNTGYLNTKESPVYIFNKITKVKREKIIFPAFFFFEWKGGYKESWKASFENIGGKSDIEKLLKLPNFSYKVFEEISGITKKMIQKKLKELEKQ